MYTEKIQLWVGVYLCKINTGLMELSRMGDELIGGYSQLSEEILLYMENINSFLTFLLKEEQAQYLFQFEEGLTAYSRGVSQLSEGASEFK